MKRFAEGDFLADGASVCWGQMITTTDINILVNNWLVLSVIIDKHAPVRQIHVSAKYCPWINKHLKNLMHARDRLKKQSFRANAL